MKVAILMGSPNDRDQMQGAADTLEAFGIEADVRVLSAHRNPAEVTALATSARENGYIAFICGAGMAAHLAGVVAAHTTLPVVGVPLSGGAINGVDALYSTVQMPVSLPSFRLWSRPRMRTRLRAKRSLKTLELFSPRRRHVSRVRSRAFSVRLHILASTPMRC